MQRLLVYIRNRYQTSSAGYRYVLFQKMRLTSLPGCDACQRLLFLTRVGDVMKETLSV